MNTTHTPHNPNVYILPGQRVGAETAADAVFVPDTPETLLQPDRPAEQLNYARDVLDTQVAAQETPIDPMQAQYQAEALALEAASGVERTRNDDYLDVTNNGAAAVTAREDCYRQIAAQYKRNQLELTA